MENEYEYSDRPALFFCLQPKRKRLREMAQACRSLKQQIKELEGMEREYDSDDPVERAANDMTIGKLKEVLIGARSYIKHGGNPRRAFNKIEIYNIECRMFWLLYEPFPSCVNDTMHPSNPFE